MSAFQPPIEAEGITHLPHKIVALKKKTTEATANKYYFSLCSFLYMPNPSQQATVTKNKSGMEGRRKGLGLRDKPDRWTWVKATSNF